MCESGNQATPTLPSPWSGGGNKHIFCTRPTISEGAKFTPSNPCFANLRNLALVRGIRNGVKATDEGRVETTRIGESFRPERGRTRRFRCDDSTDVRDP